MIVNIRNKSLFLALSAVLAGYQPGTAASAPRLAQIRSAQQSEPSSSLEVDSTRLTVAKEQPQGTPGTHASRPAISIVFAHDPGQGRYDGVVGSPGDIWNFVDIGTTAVDYLRSPEGTGTPMTLRVTRHDGEWGIRGQSGIFHGYIYHNCQCVDLSATISGMPPGRYSAYVYAHGDAPDQNADVELEVGPESYGHKSTLNDGTWRFRSNSFEEGVQYVRFEFTAEKDQPVTITSHRAGSGYSMLNAIQIVPLEAGR